MAIATVTRLSFLGLVAIRISGKICTSLVEIRTSLMSSILAMISMVIMAIHVAFGSIV